MNQLEIFTNPEFGTIRTMGTEAQPLFCLVDLCKALSLNPSKLSQRLGDDVLSKYPIQDELNRTQLANFVNEDGLYDVILDSRKPFFTKSAQKAAQMKVCGRKKIFR